MTKTKDALPYKQSACRIKKELVCISPKSKTLNPNIQILNKFKIPMTKTKNYTVIG